MTNKLLLLDEDTLHVILHCLKAVPQSPSLGLVGGEVAIPTLIENLQTDFFKPEYAEVVPFFAAPSDHPAVAAAMDQATDNLEIDDQAILSEGEAGTWVSAWIFVPRD